MLNEGQGGLAGRDGVGLRYAFGWEGFLAWAGRRVLESDSELPEEVLPVAAAALAITLGWREGLRATLDRLPRCLTLASARRALGLLRLRVALEGGVPSDPRPFLPRCHEPMTAWRPALLTLMAHREQGCEKGFVPLAAALAATRFRHRLRERVAGLGYDVDVPEWGNTLIHPALEYDLADALRRLGPAMESRAGGTWEAAWACVDLTKLESRVAWFVGGRPDLAQLILLDDRLALATVWAMSDRPERARHWLEAWRAAPAFRAAGEAVAAAAMVARVAELPASKPGVEAESILSRLAKTPDPSVALQAPFWLLENRGGPMCRLLMEGRRGEARAVRTVLDRPDQRRALAPFWLLGPGDTSAVLALARWLRPRVREARDRERLLPLEAR